MSLFGFGSGGGAFKPVTPAANPKEAGIAPIERKIATVKKDPVIVVPPIIPRKSDSPMTESLTHSIKK